MPLFVFILHMKQDCMNLSLSLPLLFHLSLCSSPSHSLTHSLSITLFVFLSLSLSFSSSLCTSLCLTLSQFLSLPLFHFVSPCLSLYSISLPLSHSTCFNKFCLSSTYSFQVRDDIGTDVMRRSLSKHFVTGSEDTCVVSIVLMKRTLDFEIEERFWRPIFHALQILVNYYRVILPSMQSQRSIDDGRGLGLSS